jgi:hypothetical protein
MKNILLTILLLIPFVSHTQKIEEVNGKLQAKIEYSVDGKKSAYILSKCYSWVETKFMDREMIVSDCDPHNKRIMCIAFTYDFDFVLEIICVDGRFIAKFSNFFWHDKPLEQKRRKIKPIEEYLFLLCGDMQRSVRS